MDKLAVADLFSLRCHYVSLKTMNVFIKKTIIESIIIFFYKKKANQPVFPDLYLLHFILVQFQNVVPKHKKWQYYFMVL